MSTSNLTDKQLLAKMEVPGMEGVFVLGSFARHVTIYSQQMRALNLVHALKAEGRFGRHDRVAVIGAGAAGLTAAAAAAVHGADVVILEKLPGPFSLQRKGSKRHIHPHIYYWPELPSKNDCAGLPLLDWKAGDPAQVFGEMESWWKEKILQKASPQITPRYNTSVLAIEHDRERSCVYVSWRDQFAEGHSPFKIVILAVGFGLDDGKSVAAGGVQQTWAKDYWATDDLDDRQAQRHLLVSGTGDGGLTDLMRLCIANFQHDKVIGAFASAPGLEQLRGDLLQLEQDAIGKPSELTASYRDLVARYDAPIREVADRFERRSEITAVLTNLGGNLLGPNSSILNRFIVSVLDHLGWFKYIPGRAQGEPVRTDEGKFRVNFKGGDEKVFDAIIERHGPNPALKVHFEDIWEKCKPLRDEWAGLSQLEDKTWVKRYDDDEYDVRVLEPSHAPRAAARDLLTRLREYDFGNEHWCMVVTPRPSAGGGESPLEHYMRLVLRNWKRVANIETEVPRPLNRRHVTVRVGETLSDPEHYDRVVRALCSADVAAFDITSYDPVVMMLLGIRSVVRRGVTILATDKPIEPATWAELPFNIKELNFFSTYKANINPESPDYPTNMLQSFITKGLSNLHKLPHYLDVPAYDWVRRLGLDEEDNQTIPVSDQILVLCSFSENYIKDCWPTVNEELQTAFSGHGQGKIVRIIDTPSPQLVSQRLYDAIKRNSLCVVDWTGWRPNVFYEFGVRLAVSDLGPVCIIAPDFLDHPGAKYAPTGAVADALHRFFKPIEYSAGGGPDPFNEMERRYVAIRDNEERLDEGRLAHDHTFRVVCDAISLRHELGNKEVYVELNTAAELMIGKEPKREGTPRLLFSQNERLAGEIKSNAVERLVAAWYYLDRRCRARELPGDQPEKKAFLAIGAKLMAIIDPVKDKELYLDISRALTPEVEDTPS